MRKIAIIGAGITGRSIAFRLLQAGYEVTLFDAESATQNTACSWQAGGMLAPWSEAAECDVEIVIAGQIALALWRAFAQSLGVSSLNEKLGTQILYHPCDEKLHEHFIRRIHRHSNKARQLMDTCEEVWTLFANESGANKLCAHLRRTRERLQQIAVSETRHLKSREFNVSHLLKFEKWVCPRCVMMQLEDSILKAGGRWYRQTQVERVENASVVCGSQKYHFDKVIDCAGIGSKKLLKLSLRGVRGEALLIRSHAVQFNQVIRFLHPRYPIYLIPREKDSLFYLGATQLETEARGSIWLDSCMHLLSAAMTIAPQLADAEVIDSYVGFRPAFSNNRPKIHVYQHLISVNGLFRHGFLLAPLAAEIVNQLLSLDEKKMLATAVNRPANLYGIDMHWFDK